MALPKEPRQKMINIMYLVLTALLALNVSSEILNAFKTVRRSLETTNTTVNTSTNTIMKSLEDKTKEEQTKERALEWFPKAQQVVSTSKGLYDYIENLKNEIIKRAGGKPGDFGGFKEDNLDIVTKLMVTEGKGKELLAKLTKYKADIFGIDTSIKAEFEKSLSIDVAPAPGQDGKTKEWEVSYFHMVPTVAGLTILTKFQNDIRTSENKVVAFCHQKVGEVKVIFDSYAPIVGQSSSYLFPGQELEIKAGVGAYSKTAQPSIVVNGSSVPIGTEGFASYKTTVNGVGSHSIPVKISYFNQVTGKQEQKDVTIEYTVGSPSGASVALDEMNVLYIGWQNKLTIASSTGDEKTQVSISGGGGSLQKTGPGKYIATVNSVTDDCKINVTVDGKTSSFPFRVRTIPDPVATVGGVASNENMTAGQFKAQTGVGAYIKDFPLNIKYSVVSFTLTADNADGDVDEAPCQGNTWSPKALGMIRALAPGRMVTIDQIRAQGPDGRVRKIPGLTYYIK